MIINTIKIFCYLETITETNKRKEEGQKPNLILGFKNWLCKYIWESFNLTDVKKKKKTYKGDNLTQDQ